MRAESVFMNHETKHMVYEPGERIDEYWNIQFQYLVDDGMITTEEEKAYFQSSEYRDVLKGHMSRTPDKLHMIYFVREGIRIGARMLSCAH